MSLTDKDMLAMAARLAIAGHAKVNILKTDETAIVLPGKRGKKITLRLNMSGKTIERLPKGNRAPHPTSAAGRAAKERPNLRALHLNFGAPQEAPPVLNFPQLTFNPARSFQVLIWDAS